MPRVIPVRKTQRWKIWRSWNWSAILVRAAVVCGLAYMACLLQVNMVSSHVKEAEQQTMILQRGITQVQSNIYAVTKDSSFIALSAVNTIALREPNDKDILYMQVPQTGLAMR